eukprot:c11502_g1_i1.p1 GENE.c11502_g1_i1~~c11502_g1_i1.p1  ORF type:complete len:177 (+),score=43.96 c11502_g1_i1:151-681(+)
MTLIMVGTPLAMETQYGYNMDTISLTIQFHLFGMFIPGFFTGHIIDCIGIPLVILLGLLSFSGSVIIAVFVHSPLFFYIGLTLLGMGWNLCYVGGTRLLGLSHTGPEGSKVQGFAEFSTQLSNALAGLSSGFILENENGWQILNLTVTPVLIITLFATIYIISLDGYRPQQYGSNN